MVMSALLASGGCDGPITSSPSASQRTWDGAFLVDAVTIDCDASGWVYDVRTRGWGDEITVDVRGAVHGAIVFDEHHALGELEHGDDWARFGVTLTRAGYGEAYESGRSTALDCAAKAFVTYGIAAWRYDGELQECVAYGVDPEGLFPGCASWGAGH